MTDGRRWCPSLLSVSFRLLFFSKISHWGIENRLHWVLDVSFGEDSNRTRRGNGAENLTKIRRLARGLLGGVKGKQSVPRLMFRAALSPELRTSVIEKIAKGKF